MGGRNGPDCGRYRHLSRPAECEDHGALCPAAVEIVRRFEETKAVHGPEQATKAFYRFSEDVYYIRSDRIKRNAGWTAETAYGKLDITINLSKPEKDPKAIAAAKERLNPIIRDVFFVKKMSGTRGDRITRRVKTFVSFR